MKLVIEQAEILIDTTAPTFEELVSQNHLDYKPTPEELRLHASSWAVDQGQDEKTAKAFAEFYAQTNNDKPWGACMPRQRALKIEYPRYLEEQTLKNLHPSRRLMGVSR
jgi:hypothetical protein